MLDYFAVYIYINLCGGTTCVLDGYKMTEQSLVESID